MDSFPGPWRGSSHILHPGGLRVWLINAQLARRHGEILVTARGARGRPGNPEKLLGNGRCRIMYGEDCIFLNLYSLYSV